MANSQRGARPFPMQMILINGSNPLRDPVLPGAHVWRMPLGRSIFLSRQIRGLVLKLILTGRYWTYSAFLIRVKISHKDGLACQWRITFFPWTLAPNDERRLLNRNQFWAYLTCLIPVILQGMTFFLIFILRFLVTISYRLPIIIWQYASYIFAILVSFFFFYLISAL